MFKHSTRVRSDSSDRSSTDGASSSEVVNVGVVNGVVNQEHAAFAASRLFELAAAHRCSGAARHELVRLLRAEEAGHHSDLG